MLLSLRWLNKIFPSGLSPDELIESLIRGGLEVEKCVDLGMQSGRIVVAKVLEITKHPKADRLTLVTADVGGEKPVQIVCGATNLHEGMRVPCALPGARLPDSTTIKKAKIRGQASEGMLCSARELGFGSDHSGILELPEDYEIGEPFDLILDVKVTPDRADCLSVMGIARDVAAMMGKKVYPPVPRVSETLEKTDQFLDLLVQARDACPSYTCRFFKEATLGPSPVWLRRALESAGLRTINCVVDVTNYVMIELGIPLHAFDFERILGGKIIVRLAREGETLLTLDDRELHLDPRDLVIADAEHPIALAGVIGGKVAQVTEKTSRIVLECAYFDPVTIRKAARRHSISTDASYRFERGVDRAGLTLSMSRAAQMITELAHCEVTKGCLEVHQSQKAPENPILLRVARLNAVLGINLSNTEVADFLVNLDFEIRRSEGDSLFVVAPSYRVDIESDVDLIEEVARLYGYDNIPETMPAIVSSASKEELTPRIYLRRMRSSLIGMGLSEVVNMTFVSDESARRCKMDPDSQPRLTNPLTVDQAIMRPCLLGGLLETAAYNQRQGAERVALFEIGKIFPAGARPGHEEDEGLSLAIVLSGAGPANWTRPSRVFDLYDMKGVLESLGEQMGAGEIQLHTPEGSELYHPGCSAAFGWRSQQLGAFGELHPSLAADYDLRGRVYGAEFDLAKTIELIGREAVRFASIPRFPPSQRDLALVVDQDQKAGQLIEIAREAGQPLLEELTVVDCYQGDGVPPGKKSLALRFRLRSLDATLTEDAINGVMNKIIGELQSRCGATLRQ